MKSTSCHATGIIISLAVLCSAMIWMQWPANASHPPQTPIGIIQQLDSYAMANDWPEAHSLFDYRFKGRDMIPDLWDTGTPASQVGLVNMLQKMFVSTWQNFHKHGPSLDLLQTEIGPGLVMVEQGVQKQRTTLRYWLIQRNAGWQVIDRTSREGKMHIESSGKVNVVRTRIANQLGNQPMTLSDFVANAPSWVKRVRARRFRVGDGELNRQ